MTVTSLRTRCRAALLLCLTLLGAGAHAAITLSDPVPVGPQVKVGKLANGLTYYVQRNTRPEQKAELRLVVKAGSILEDDDQQGLAHFVEHMAFNGSTHFKKHELVSYLQSIGVQFGADLNAYTSFDETVYILPIPTDKASHLESGFQVLEDWAHGLTLNDADIDKERDIILEEARRGKGAADRINKVLYPKLFNGSRYAERLPIGQEAILKQFKPDALRRFYRDWYRPDLMAVIVVGDIDPAQAESMIRAHFAGLINPKQERARTQAQVPTLAATEAVVVTDPEVGNNTITIRYPLHDMKEPATFAEYRAKLVETLFAGMLGERMQELTQQADPPFVGGGSGVGRLVRNYHSYLSQALLGRGGALPAITALVQENERARQFGFSAAELERAKKNMLRNVERAYNERDKSDSSSYAAEYIRNFLDQETIPGIDNEYHYLQEFLPSISLDELNRFAHNTIPSKAAKLVIYTGSTKGETPPTKETLLAAVNSAEQSAISAHTERALAAALMEKPPVAGRIVADTSNTQLGLTMLTLSNGVKVILKPTTFKNDQVLMSAVRYGGQSLFEDKDNYNAQYASAIVAAMGLKDFSPLELQNMLAGKAASISTNLGMYTDFISGSAGNQDVDTMLQLLHLRFAGVRRDDKLYQSFIGKQRDLARNAMARPESLLQDTLSTTLYNGHPRAPRVPRPEYLDQVSLDRALDIFSARYRSAKDFTFILVGSFDVARIKPLVATYLGSLATPEIVTSYRDIGLYPVGGGIKQEVRKGSEAQSTVSLNYSGAAPFSDDARLRLSALTDVLNIKINDVLREKLTLIYSGSMNGRLDKIPREQYSINVTLPCGPDNVDKVIDAMLAEIDKIRRDGPDEGDLNKVKQKYLQSHQKSMQDNSYWLGRLQASVLQGTDPAAILHVEQRINAITLADLKAAAGLYFNQRNLVQVVLNPEK